jgi:hypothetical protein
MDTEPYPRFKFSTLPVLAMFGIMHLVLARNPKLLLSVYPRLQPASMHHIPLVISLPVTSALAGWIVPLDCLRTIPNKNAVYDRDRRIADMGPEMARGWRKVLLERAQAGRQIKELATLDSDIGTTDTV